MNVALFRSAVLCTVVTLATTGLKAQEPSMAYAQDAGGTPMAESNWSAPGGYGNSYGMMGPAYGYSPSATRYVRDYGGVEGVVGPSPKLFATVEAIGMTLNPGNHHPQVVAVNEDTNAPVLGTNTSPYEMEVGYRATAAALFANGLQVEGVYFRMSQWQSSGIAEGSNNLALNGDLAYITTADFYDVDRIAVRQEVTLDNWEVNTYWPLGVTDFSWLTGARYVDMTEIYNLNALDYDTGTSIYDIKTRNRLYGAQIGCRYKRDYGRLGLDFVMKTGLYANDAKQHSLITGFDGASTVRDVTSDLTRAAFIGEVGLTGTMQLTSWAWLRAGYSAIWMEGIARAANQLDMTTMASSGTGLNFTSGALIHGVNLGLEARW